MLNAKISNKLSKSVLIFLGVYVAVVATFIGVGFIVGAEAPYAWSDGIGWFGLLLAVKRYVGTAHANTVFNYRPGNIILFIFILLVLILLPLIFILLSNRKRKLSELSVSEREIVGYYTAFIPVAKITLRMPIEKIDNISAVNSFFFLFTGKAIKIRSTSGVISIPYVLNADEIVAYISEAIEMARKEQAKPISQESQPAQSDYTESLKKLAELKDAGIISEEEFNQKKNELLKKI